MGGLGGLFTHWIEIVYVLLRRTQYIPKKVAELTPNVHLILIFDNKTARKLTSRPTYCVC